MNLGHFGLERSLRKPGGGFHSPLSQLQCSELPFEVRMVWVPALLFQAKTRTAYCPGLSDLSSKLFQPDLLGIDIRVSS